MELWSWYIWKNLVENLKYCILTYILWFWQWLLRNDIKVWVSSVFSRSNDTFIMRTLGQGKLEVIISINFWPTFYGSQTCHFLIDLWNCKIPHLTNLACCPKHAFFFSWIGLILTKQYWRFIDKHILVVKFSVSSTCIGRDEWKKILQRPKKGEDDYVIAPVHSC